MLLAASEARLRDQSGAHCLCKRTTSHACQPSSPALLQSHSGVMLPVESRDAAGSARSGRAHSCRALDAMFEVASKSLSAACRGGRDVTITVPYG